MTDLPEWMNVILLCERMDWHKLPSDIENEPMEWVARLTEYFYLNGMQGNPVH